ncbi:MAG: hypothetical protein GY925_04525 [Actinomycetia bacterium]|nr:hypothetical protein [Actinomycetes bacterium]
MPINIEADNVKIGAGGTLAFTNGATFSPSAWSVFTPGYRTLTVQMFGPKKEDKVYHSPGGWRLQCTYESGRAVIYDTQTGETLGDHDNVHAVVWGEERPDQ